jgi:hypothetical protein
MFMQASVERGGESRLQEEEEGQNYDAWGRTRYSCEASHSQGRRSENYQVDTRKVAHEVTRTR